MDLVAVEDLPREVEKLGKRRGEGKEKYLTFPPFHALYPKPLPIKHPIPIQ